MGILLTAVAIALGLSLAEIFRRGLDWLLIALSDLAARGVSDQGPVMNQGDLPQEGRARGPQVAA